MNGNNQPKRILRHAMQRLHVTRLNTLLLHVYHVSTLMPHEYFSLFHLFSRRSFKPSASYLVDTVITQR